MLIRMPDGSYLDPSKVVAVYESGEVDEITVKISGETLSFYVDEWKASEGAFKKHSSQDLVDEIVRRINAATETK